MASTCQTIKERGRMTYSRKSSLWPSTSQRMNALSAFAPQIRLVRGRFGIYEPIDFLALLVGYAISGERTLSDFFERVGPFAPAFMALFRRRCLPHRSS